MSTFSRMRWNSAIVENAASLVGTTIVTSGLGFVYWWLAARQFRPEAVGLAVAAIAPMTLLAEDGNKLPGVPRVQSEVFLAAGKTYDVTIQPKQTTAGTYDAATYPVFDRALALSTSNQRDGGMQVYVNVAGGAPGTSTV